MLSADFAIIIRKWKTMLDNVFFVRFSNILPLILLGLDISFISSRKRISSNGNDLISSSRILILFLLFKCINLERLRDKCFLLFCLILSMRFFRILLGKKWVPIFSGLVVLPCDKEALAANMFHSWVVRLLTEAGSCILNHRFICANKTIALF